MPLCWFCLTVQSVPSFFPPITWMRLKFSVTASPSWSAEASNAVVRPSTSKTSWLRATTLPSQRRYMCVSVSVTPTEFLLEFNSHKKNQGSTGVQYNGIILIPRYIDIHKHSTFGVGKSFSVFFKEVSYAHQGSIYLIKNRVKCNTMKYFFFHSNTFFYLNTFSNVIDSCDGKAEFSASLLSPVSHDPSEIILKLICWSRNIPYYYQCCFIYM